MQTQRKQICVAVDIEKTGPLLVKHKLPSIGFFVGDDQGNMIRSKKINTIVKWPGHKETLLKNDDPEDRGNHIVFEMDYGDFEKECWETHWSKLPLEMINKYKENALSEYESTQKIIEFMNELEHDFPEETNEIVFLTDNGPFDLPNIDFRLEHFFNRKPLRYSSVNRYRTVFQVDDMLFMIPEPHLSESLKSINEQQKQTHDPVDDAKNIYLQYIAVKRYQNIITENEID